MAIRNYLKVFADGHTEATKFRPLFQEGERERAYAGENPDVLVDGKWWNSTNGDELLSGGNFDSQADVDLWTTEASSALSFNDGVMRVTSTGGYPNGTRQFSVTKGVKYTLKATIINGTADGLIDIFSGASTRYTRLQGSFVSYDFTAIDNIAYIWCGTRSPTSGTYAQFDNISVYKTEIIPDIVYPTQFTYLSKDDKLASFLIAGGQPVDVTYEYDSPSIVQDVIQASRFISQDLVLSNLTTVDPFILGMVWNDSNTLKISQG